MYIHEALNARSDDRPYIMREIWKNWGSDPACHPRLLPGSTRQGLALFSRMQLRGSFGWVPSLEDLLADDWIAVH